MRRVTIHSSLRVVPGAILVAVAATLLSGCMPIWQKQELEDEISRLEERQNKLEEEAQNREEEFATMVEDAQSDIDELQEVLEEAREILQRDSAELGADIQEARREIGNLRGEVESLQFQYRRLEESFKTFQTDFDRLFADVEPDELLDKAQKYREEGEYDLARRALERFVQDYGDHELAGEARLELGEIYYELEMWESAGHIFGQVREDATSEARQARATRRTGDVFFQLGECEDAKLFLESVIADYPGSEEVSDARERLDEIEQGNCPPESTE